MNSTLHWFLSFSLPLSIFILWQTLGHLRDWASPYHRLIISFPLGAAFLVMFTELSAPLTHQLSVSLFISTITLGVLNFVFLKLWPRPFHGSWKIHRSWELFGILFWAIAISTLVCIVIWKFAFHDQISTQGHPSVVEAMLRGNFPPHLQIFPDIPLKYHFGSDLLSAIFAYLTGLPAYRAIDITQIFGWIFSIASLYVFCREVGMNRGWTFLALNWVLLGAGWVYLLKPWLDIPPATAAVDYNWPDNYVIFKHYINPGTISYFFQNPYSLGYPIFFSYLTVLQAWFQKRKLWLLIFPAIILGALSLIQVMLFSTALGATLVALFGQVIFEKKKWIQFILSSLIILIATLLLGALLGGMLDRSDQYANGLLVFHWHPNYLRYAIFAGRLDLNFEQSFLWYLCSLGSLAILGFPAILFAFLSLLKKYQPMMLFLSSFAIASFSLPQFFSYEYSWDIIKWFTGIQLTLTLLILWLGSQSKKLSRWLFIILIPFITLDIIPSMRFLHCLSFFEATHFQGTQRSWWAAVIHPPSPPIDFIVQKLRGAPWDEMVLAPIDLSKTLAHYSGQAMAMIDYNTTAFGLKPEVFQRRDALLKNSWVNFSIYLMKQNHFGWIVYPCDVFEKIFSPRSQQSIQEAIISGELTRINIPQEMGCWNVYHVL